MVSLKEIMSAFAKINGGYVSLQSTSENTLEASVDIDDDHYAVAKFVNGVLDTVDFVDPLKRKTLTSTFDNEDDTIEKIVDRLHAAIDNISRR